jgi:hypothetical protein
MPTARNCVYAAARDQRKMTARRLLRYRALLHRRRLTWGWIVLDLVGIVFSSVMMLFVIFRAVQLDGSRPWFEKPPPDPAPEAATPRSGRSAVQPAPAQPLRAPPPSIWRGKRR